MNNVFSTVLQLDTHPFRTGVDEAPSQLNVPLLISMVLLPGTKTQLYFTHTHTYVLLQPAFGIHCTQPAYWINYTLRHFHMCSLYLKLELWTFIRYIG